MPFAVDESSLYDSEPIELYEFAYQGNILRYTSSDKDFLWQGATYTSAPLQRSEIFEGTEQAKNELKLTCDAHFAPAELFAVFPPEDVVGLVVKRIQLGSLTDVDVIWLGRVAAVDWPPLHSELTCESVYTALKQPGLRRLYGRNCPHVLYGTRCRANLLAFQIALNLTWAADTTLTATVFGTYPNGYFAGGKVVWQQVPGYFVRRGIKSHIGNDIVVSYPMPGIGPGAAIVAAPGCDHTFPICGSKFANQLNYGGWPFSQQKNPFGTESVF